VSRPESATAGLRERVFRRDRYRCSYCGEEYPAAELTLDHVEPRMRGGDRSEGNLVTCCRACNAAKGGEPAWSYLARNAEARARFLEAVAGCDTRHARAVWPRLLRAIEQAAGR
jgi:5-methylcytosine-specific restriction endonuclease McrA